MANKQVRVGVIGAGGIARNVHLPSLSEIPEANIVAICDLVYTKAQEMAAKYNIPGVYWDMYEMIEKENLDCAYVLVEPDRLFRAASDCMKRGLNVLMEKPAGISAHQTNALCRIAKENNVICAVAMNRRHIPVVQEVKRIMSEVTEITEVSGAFLKSTNLENSWQYASAFDCDGIHALDLVRYLAGSEVDKCATLTARHCGCKVDNAWSTVMHFENGVTGILRSNYQTGARVHTFEVHGPGASAFINLGMGGDECEADIIFSNNGEMYSLASAGVGGIRKMHIDGRELAKSQNFYAFYGYKQEDIDFIHAVLEGRAPLCTIDDASKSMELCELIHKSSF